MKKKLIIPFLLLSLFLFNISLAQKAEWAKFDESAWEVQAKKYEFKEHKGKPALYLENGAASLKGASLKNGVIEYDILFAESRKFLGVRFRQQDTNNFEDFYIRAHQSGNPDAMQYTPVFNGISGWQLYYGEGHSTAYSYNFNEWIHVKLLVADDKMDVFINDMAQPVLHVNDLKREAEAGGIGFSTGGGSAYFANLSYQSMENVELVSNVKENPTPELGTIQKWEVSPAFAQSDLDNVYSLKDKKDMDGMGWKPLWSEFTGTANLAQMVVFSKETNTVFAKVTINSSKNQVKKLDFGYSDIAKVFVNEQLVYSGQRTFRTRDYRYLGTIGYFDAVYLDLKKGKNEIVFAITENFGGWGLKAKLADMEGIEMEQ
ncbi:hypothetical protein R9C00_25510 [Flammeovirgaceae bacterium SG7u.111]|nr:hypothetical protein [Flammeovirgaceae bacterium SG7u.132]WPO35055.1 hypothetical protein R9C00_25510 [Flammeovirgaceae bacterium SG7u.111]